MVGFVAATFLRGVPYIQVPTSLLAMVDSSIGGKTGVDTIFGKNLVGAFHQPLRVYIDLSLLRSLPSRQLSNGMAEVIKTAAIRSADEFSFLESHVSSILAGDADALLTAVLGSVRAKAAIVTADEREGGLRELLNFGHSIGHAVESLMQPGMLHGEAVAIGMVKEAELARLLGHLSQAVLGRLTRLLDAYALPTELPAGLAMDDLMDRMAVDKKNKGGKKAVVILAGIGATYQKRATIVQDQAIRTVLSPALTIIPPPARVTAALAVPGSKSISNRALLLACLGSGECRCEFLVLNMAFLGWNWMDLVGFCCILMVF